MQKVARVYLRVSTDKQDLERQDKVIADAKQSGYYIAAVYKEKASGAILNRAELLRMIDDLQQGEVVVAEKIDRISRLPLPEAEKLIEAIKAKGAKLAVPGIIDLSELSNSLDGVSKIVVETVQDLILKIALQSSRDDYEDRKKRVKQGIDRAKRRGAFKGRKPNEEQQKKIIQLRGQGFSISETSKILNCSLSQVKLITKNNKIASELDSK